MRFFALPAALLFAGAACSRHAPRQAAAPTPSPSPPAVIQIYSRYAIGNDLQFVLDELGASDQAVRYRSGLGPDEMSMVYFLVNGDLHVDAKKENGRWVLRAVPFAELAAGRSIEQRLEAWDRGADPQNDRGLKRNK